jgi:PKHD-type hydroxylase
MILNNYFWYFPKALSPEICKQIKTFALNKKKQKFARVGRFKPEIKKLSKEDKKEILKIRNSNVIWLDDPWIYNMLHPYVDTANSSSGWNFQWSRSEAVQFTIYRKDQFYDWHCDASPGDPTNRKLSVSVQLDDPNDYEGGNLLFDPRDITPNGGSRIVEDPAIRPQGTIVVFPSFVWHKVTPVTKGTRHSLVMWSYGEPFK